MAGNEKTYENKIKKYLQSVGAWDTIEDYVTSLDVAKFLNVSHVDVIRTIKSALTNHVKGITVETRVDSCHRQQLIYVLTPMALAKILMKRRQYHDIKLSEIVLSHYCGCCWKPVIDYETSYLISDTGLLYSVNSNVIKTGSCNNSGYNIVTLYNGDKVEGRLVHRLVAETFLHNPDPQTFTDVNHINGIKIDNRVSNLEWCSRSYNHLHAYQTGLKSSIINNITDKSKEYILTSTLSISELSRELGLSRYIIRTIKRRG